MAKSIPTAREFFNRADHFHHTALMLLMQPQEMVSIYSYPHIVLKAFATEAYLKSSILIEGGTFPNIHHLLSLFDKLELDSKKLIQKWWDNETLPKLKKLAAQKPADLKVPRRMREALNQSADAFLEWRYQTQGDTPAFTIMAFPSYVRRRILQKEPDWAPAPSNPLAWLNSPEPEIVKAKQDGFVHSRIRPSNFDSESPVFQSPPRDAPDADDGGPR